MNDAWLKADLDRMLVESLERHIEQLAAVCRYLRGEAERLAEERNQLQVELNGANISILALLNASAHVDEELERIANE